MKTLSHKLNPRPEDIERNKTERKKALIVDDETDICYLLSNILKQRNIQTIFAGTLAEAERMMQSSHPFLVFLDNHLPDGLGVNQIKRWKEKFPLTRFIMITAHDSGEEERKAKTDGAEHFIDKPFSRDIILKAIGEA